MKNTILEHCQKCAAHHVAMAKCHKAAAEETSGATQQFHQSATALHADEASRYIALHKCISAAPDDDTSGVHVSTNTPGIDGDTGASRKVTLGMPETRDSDLRKLVPDGARTVLPTDGLQLVNRPGAPAPAVDLETIPTALQDMFPNL
jgi:hypothetical protein